MCLKRGTGYRAATLPGWAADVILGRVEQKEGREANNGSFVLFLLACLAHVLSCSLSLKFLSWPVVYCWLAWSPL